MKNELKTKVKEKKYELVNLIFKALKQYATTSKVIQINNKEETIFQISKHKLILKRETKEEEADELKQIKHS